MSIRSILSVGLLLAGCHAMNQSFAAYKTAFGRTYQEGSHEHQMREQLFHKRTSEMMDHNSAGRTWQKGLNQFTDRTENEMAAMRGYKRTFPTSSLSSSSSSFGGTSVLELEGDVEVCAAAGVSCLDQQQSCCGDLICSSAGVCDKQVTITESKDWSSLATSKTVMDQGSCGSCWAVAASAAIQLQAAKLYPNFDKVLSPQSMLSCTPNKMECGGQGGCKGATPGLGFEWAQKSGGLAPLDAEKYTATDNGATCDGSKKVSFLQLGLTNRHEQSAQKALVSIGGWRKVEQNSAAKVMDALVNAGPLAVAIVGKEIQAYSGGVIDSCNKNFVVDHAVVMMGYGNDPQAGMYWKIRNSWGPNWGEAGFLRLRRHTPKGEEPCGWDREPEVGIVCKDPKTGKYPAKTWVCGECGIINDAAYPVGVKVPPALLSGPVL